MIVFCRDYHRAVTYLCGVPPLTDDTKPRTHMKFRHLGWAGVEIEHDGQTLLIDCIKDSFPLIPAEAVVSPSPRGASVALVTHLHSDHADPATIAAALAEGAPVFRPEPNPGSGDDLKLT